MAQSTADGIYFGMMSGTSLDGVDAVAVEWREGAVPRVLAQSAIGFPGPLRDELHGLQQVGYDEIDREARAANQLAQCYAQCSAALLELGSLHASEVRAIGVHGQTIRHRPERGYTRQTNNPALLAELSGIDVIADFRSRDIAAGGQGAPLVPAFHATVFGAPGTTRVVCNIGGISNLSVLHADGKISGFDCGPGNALLDYWAHRHLQQRYDDGGAYAAQGQVIQPLLADLLGEPFFALAPPKSTGRDLFNSGWLTAKLASHGALAPADVQATLTFLTAVSIAREIERHAIDCDAVFVCGGGALNRTLMRDLENALSTLSLHVAVQATDVLGVPALQVEAFAFAWLARQFVARQAGNLTAVTGAAGPRVLGALYPR
jgi:anhydro-N-acetylmuramic acid kinase